MQLVFGDADGAFEHVFDNLRGFVVRINDRTDMVIDTTNDGEWLGLYGRLWDNTEGEPSDHPALFRFDEIDSVEVY